MTPQPPKHWGKTLEYFSPNVHARTNRIAVTAMILGIAGIVLSCIGGVFFSLAGVLLGLISRRQILKDPEQWSGLGYANTGIKLGVVGVLVFIFIIYITMPPRRNRELANRATCAANLTGIAKAMIVYASANHDVFPMAGRPTSSGLYRSDLGIVSTTTDATKALEEMHVNPATAGNSASCLWMLAVNGQIAPKSLQCKSDPWGTTPAMLVDSTGLYFLTPQKPGELSYSIVYPWNETREAGEWWKEDVDPSRPILSDMAPLQGTGKPRRDVTKAGVAKVNEFNSFNHKGDGQNVAFADGHVDWTRKPTVGQGDENIFADETVGRAVTAPTPGNVGTAWMRKVCPFDTIMVPLRDGDSGAIK